jgi:hypothetical protein
MHALPETKLSLLTVLIIVFSLHIIFVLVFIFCIEIEPDPILRGLLCFFLRFYSLEPSIQHPIRIIQY